MANIEDLVTCLAGASNIEDIQGSGSTSVLVDNEDGTYTHNGGDGGDDTVVETGAYSNPYTPADPSAWSFVPANSGQALDVLANRKSRVEVAPGNPCKLRHVDDLGVQDASWFFADDAYVNANAAPQTSLTVLSSSLTDAFGTAWEQITPSHLTITNPSDCYEMLAHINHFSRSRTDRIYTADGRLPNVGVFNSVRIEHTVRFNGGGWTNVTYWDDVIRNGTVGYGYVNPATSARIIPPGGTLTIDYRTRILYFGDTASVHSSLWNSFVFIPAGGVNVIGHTIRA